MKESMFSKFDKIKYDVDANRNLNRMLTEN